MRADSVKPAKRYKGSTPDVPSVKTPKASKGTATSNCHCPRRHLTRRCESERVFRFASEDQIRPQEIAAEARLHCSDAGRLDVRRPFFVARKSALERMHRGASRTTSSRGSSGVPSRIERHAGPARPAPEPRLRGLCSCGVATYHAAHPLDEHRRSSRPGSRRMRCCSVAFTMLATPGGWRSAWRFVAGLRWLWSGVPAAEEPLPA